MLSYRHAFHAGNHADVIKHLCLITAVKAMCRKEKPFVYFDTHAGAGYYRLDGEWAQKTAEAETGILKLIRMRAESRKENPSGMSFSGHPVIDEYLELCAAWYFNGHCYPGSPAIAHHFMRKEDQIVLMELHNTEYEELRTNVRELTRAGPPHIHLHHRNGFETLSALTPPRLPLPNRGLVLIDPSYETDSDFTDVPETVQTVLKKWSGARILIWYPLVKRREREIALLKETLENTAGRMEKKIFFFDCPLYEPQETGMYGSGMCLLNAPWLIYDELASLSPDIFELLKCSL